MSNRRKLDGIPGSIYLDNRGGKNLLIVKVKGRKVHTGLSDTVPNRKLAEDIKKALYKEYLSGHTDTHAKKPPPTMAEALEAFMKYHCCNLAEKTGKLYQRIISEINIEHEVLNAENLVESAYNFVKNTKLSKVSINTYLTHYQAFCGFCHEHFKIEFVSVKKKFRQKPPPKIIKVFFDEEIQRLLSVIHDKDVEFYLLVRLLLASGMRIGEALRLNSSQLLTDRIIIPNKITKEQESIPISEEIREILKQIGKQGKMFRWSEETYSRLNRRLSAFMELADVYKDDRSFHEFRRTFLWHLFRAEVPTHIAQKLMRHADIKTTIEHYTYFEISDLTKSLNQKHQVSCDQFATK